MKYHNLEKNFHFDCTNCKNVHLKNVKQIYNHENEFHTSLNKETTNRFQCDKCRFSASINESIIIFSHCKIHLLNKESVKCFYCEVVTQTLSGLRSHLRRKHSSFNEEIPSSVSNASDTYQSDDNIQVDNTENEHLSDMEQEESLLNVDTKFYQRIYHFLLLIKTKGLPEIMINIILSEIKILTEF